MLNHKEIEENILKFWREKRIREKLNEKHKDKPFYFCEGPPYATGDPHPGTVWNHVIKDMYLRYIRMKGYYVHDRAGFDTHGLPIEVKVEKEEGVTSKGDIEEKIGVKTFIDKCKRFATRYIKSMSEKFERFGVWLDFENHYATYRNSYMEQVWQNIKRADDKGLLYEGNYVVPYCPRCQTTLANYELEYFEKEDPSIFVKFKLKDKPNEYLVIWTTTPWTLISNLAVMVHPSATYVRVKVDDEVWIVAKDRLDYVLEKTGKSGVIIDEMSGKRLDGLRYEHPLQEFIGKTYDRHVVLSDEYVTMEEGSGLVHCAPGHGPEDYEIGKRYDLEIYSPVTKEGTFDETAGKYAGLEVLKTNDIVIEDLEKKGALLFAETIKHRYMRCWRCKTPLIYINMKQWFIKVGDIKDKMLENIANTVWVPDYLRKRMSDFVGETSNWCISRQRYWGIPLPIWRCERCGAVKVVGSFKELPKKLDDYHRPYIDEVTLKCDSCGGEMRRVPDVLDVWVDSGNAVWASLTDDERKRYEVADFIVEGRDQVRGWFYSLLAFGTIHYDRAPYKTVMQHGMFLAEDGNTMSKSLGNFVPVEKIIEQYGADAFRLWVMKNVPWEDVKFSWNELKEAKASLNILANIGTFIDRFVDERIDYSDEDLLIEDRWIISKFNSTLKKATEAMDQYNFHIATRVLKEFAEEMLSRRYIKLVKSRIKADKKKEVALSVLFDVYFDFLKAFGIVAPFLSEHIYQTVYKKRLNGEESIFMYDWPEYDTLKIDPSVERMFDVADQVVSTVNTLRQKAGIKLRWPVEEIIFVPFDSFSEEAVMKFSDVIRDMANIKDVRIESKVDSQVKVTLDEEKIKELYKDLADDIFKEVYNVDPIELQKTVGLGKLFKGTGYELKPELVVVEESYPGYEVGLCDYGKVYLKSTLSEELFEEGMLREVIRRIQMMRKENRLVESDTIDVVINASDKLANIIEKHTDEFKRAVNASSITMTDKTQEKSWKIEGEQLSVSIKRKK
ncbi:isoleucine--tRNA ligase [Candidatus Micrarchaeota archaeon]|nr:isoleucine--tRNA ligase [Candidatus Micrarchaeota archaeon]